MWVHPTIDPAALFHDAIDGEKPESGAPAAFLRRVKRLENVGARIGRHADTGVCDRQQNVRPWTHDSMIAGICRVEIDVARFNEDPAAIRQGVTRIHDQIHDDLLDLTRISLDRSNVFRHKCLYRDVFAHQPPEELVEIHHDGVEIEDFRPQYLVAAEGQQLAKQRDGAIGGIFNAPDIAMQLRPVQAALYSHLDVTLDDGQKIIEIVRDTSRQPSHGLHLARLQQLIFEHFPVGDIDDQALHNGMAVAAAHHHRCVADPNDVPVLPRDAIFGLEGFAACAILLRGMNDGVIVAGDVTYPIFRIPKPFLRGVAKHGFDLGAAVIPLAADPTFGDVTYGRNLIDELAVFHFGFRTRTLRAHPLGK